jgi:hypothetical protein
MESRMSDMQRRAWLAWSLASLGTDEGVRPYAISILLPAQLPCAGPLATGSSTPHRRRG